MGLDVLMKGVPQENKYPDLLLSPGEYDKAREECQRTRIRSASYPKHLWTPVYLRSSYNSSGFNAIARSLTGWDLYDVFPEAKSQNEFKPDWKGALTMAQKLWEGLKKAQTFPPNDKEWMLQACEILVEEFIPLGMAHRDTAYLEWSG